VRSTLLKSLRGETPLDAEMHIFSEYQNPTPSGMRKCEIFARSRIRRRFRGVSA
jgi:hypothetical protein